MIVVHILRNQRTQKWLKYSQEWLFDILPFRKRYWWQRKLCYAALKYLDMPRATNCSFSLKEMIAKDMITQFMLLLSMESPHVSPSLITQVLTNCSLDIFSTLLDYHDILIFRITFEKILFFAISHLDDRVGMAVINLQEERQPRIIFIAVDALGNELL